MMLVTYSGQPVANLDTTRLARDTGFEPAFDVRAGVADYVAWLQDNPS